MGKKYINGSGTGVAFQILSPRPIDDRLVVENITDLDTLEPKYHGLVVFVEENDKLYVLHTDDQWVEISSGGDISLIYSSVDDYPLGSTTWDIDHNLGVLGKTRPSVIIVDGGDTVIEGEVKYMDDNNVQINFNVPVTGKAYLN